MKQLLQRLQPAIRIANDAYRQLCSNRQKQIATITALSICSAAVYAISFQGLQHQKSALGDYVLVHVALHNIAIGEEISKSNTTTLAMPAQFVLPSTLTSLPQPLTATANIVKGDVMSEQNTSARNQQVSIPAGMRAVSIVPRIAMPSLQPGAFVDIVANGQIIAAHGMVLSTFDNNIGVMIAVSEQSAPAVASAAANGEAAIVIAN